MGLSLNVNVKDCYILLTGVKKQNNLNKRTEKARLYALIHG